MKQKYWLALGVVVVGATQSGACTQFRTCNETRSCDAVEAGAPDEVAGEGGAAGAGGAAGVGGHGDAGAAGAAGAAGEMPSVACVHDSDCVNPDMVNCAVSCAAKDGVSACVVRGVDADTDGFLSASCVAAPGDDCNDRDKAIHPGAPEICDHIDNDCNGKVDVGDGLAISGKNVSLGSDSGVRAQIALDSDKATYGIVQLTQETRAMSFEAVNSKGQVSQLQPFTAAGLPVDDFGLTWGGGIFGVPWSHTVAGGSIVAFSTANSDGTVSVSHDVAIVPNSGLTQIIFDPQASRTENGTWYVLFEVGTTASTKLKLKVFTDPTPISQVDAVDLVGDHVLHAASVNVGNSVALTYDDVSTSLPTGLFGDPTSAVGIAALTLTGRRPLLASGPAGFAAATSGPGIGDPAQFYAFNSAGKPICGPLNLPGSSAMPASMAASSKGYLVALLGAGGLVAQEVLQDCTLGERFTIDSGATSSNASIAGNAAVGNAVVWTGSNGLNFRSFGPNFCD